MAAKINMRLDKNEMPSQDPNVRNKNFLEVALGYTEEQALDEAARCLNCKNHPCVNGCPVNVRIPEFIAKIVERDYEGAYQVIHQTSSLPAVCGQTRPQTAGKPVRDALRPWQEGRSRGHRPSGALCGRLAQRPLHRGS